MSPLITLINFAFDVLLIIIIIQVAVSWLIAFGVINTDNPQARNLLQLLKKVTEPLYAPLRKFIPPIGGIDITPIIVIIGLQLVRNLIINLLI